MKIYIAASILARDYARTVGNVLRSHGHTIASTWHDGELLAPTDGCLSLIQRKLLAITAMDEICGADVLLLIAHKDGKGSLFEAGFAAGKLKKVIAVGYRLDVTPMLDDPLYVSWFSAMSDALEWIDELR